MLSIPLFLFTEVPRRFKDCIESGLFDLVRTYPISPLKMVSFLTLQSLFRELLRLVATVFLAIILFDFRLSLIGTLLLLLFQVIAFFTSYGMGLILCSLLLLYGRGGGLLGYINSMMAFFAGAFFPVALFPSWIQKVSFYASPMTLLLETSRQFALVSSLTEFPYKPLCALAAWSFIFFVGKIFLEVSIRSIKKSGRCLIFTR